MPKVQTVESYLFRDLYQLYTHHSDMQDTDEFWKKFHDNVVMLDKKYENTEIAWLARALAMGMMNAIDEKVRNKQ